jgi:UDP-N-acetylmuramate dehydrogenase
MSDNKIITEKLKNVNNLKIETGVKLNKYSSFKVGGPAAIMITPQNQNSLVKAIKIIEQSDLPSFVLGSGSNIIVSDKGYHGIVIYMEELDDIHISNNLITAETGITLSRLANKARRAGLSGLEFASGIPGSLGGALYMNAGAYGGEMKHIVKSAVAVSKKGNILDLSSEKLNLSYRNSLLQKKNLIAVKAVMELSSGDKEKITAKMKKLNRKRREKQPLDWPSAGSIFKRPKDDYAGRLVEEAGMKGVTIGGAQVSEKHAGFIINKGDASALDIKQLINKVQIKVENISGIKLEVEPKFIGNFQ